MIRLPWRKPQPDFDIVTPHDTKKLKHHTAWIALPEIGDLSVLRVDDSTVVIPSGAMMPGVPFELEVKRINATDTDPGIVQSGVLVGYDLKRKNGDDDHEHR